jgi:hypothetical protein
MGSNDSSADVTEQSSRYFHKLWRTLNCLSANPVNGGIDSGKASTGIDERTPFLDYLTVLESGNPYLANGGDVFICGLKIDGDEIHGFPQLRKISDL